VTLAALSTPLDDLLEAYIAHCAVMAPSPGQLRSYIGAAETFHADLPDLGEWMTRPVDLAWSSSPGGRTRGPSSSSGS
jgi:hypothetical protein